MMTISSPSINFLTVFVNYSTVNLFCFYECPDVFFINHQLYWHFLYCFDLNNLVEKLKIKINSHIIDGKLIDGVKLKLNK